MTPSILQRRTRRGLPLWLEISVVLTVKLLLLWGAKVLWFSEPLARHMTVPESAIEQQLLGTPGRDTSPVHKN